MIQIGTLPALNNLDYMKLQESMVCPKCIDINHPAFRTGIPLVQMLYTIKGNDLRVAFVEENGGEGAVVNDLYQGDVAFFPQGLIHYQQNLGCEPATFLAALNSEDAGVVTITTRFFELPSEAIQVRYTIVMKFAHGTVDSQSSILVILH